MDVISKLNNLRESQRKIVDVKKTADSNSINDNLDSKSLEKIYKELEDLRKIKEKEYALASYPIPPYPDPRLSSYSYPAKVTTMDNEVKMIYNNEIKYLTNLAKSILYGLGAFIFFIFQDPLSLIFSMFLTALCGWNWFRYTNGKWANENIFKNFASLGSIRYHRKWGGW